MLTRPTALSTPAGVITDPTEIDTLVMKNIGFQLRSSTLRIDCAANFGAAATTSPSWLSTVGSVERDEVDLVPGNATLFVEHLEERRVQLVDRAVGGGAAAVRHWCCRS